MAIKAEDVIDIIRAAMGTVEIDIESSMDTVEAWDSLSHLNILVALDTSFDGNVAVIEEMASTTSVREILDLLKHHSLI
jgi:acyl carrier protein